MGYKKEFVQRVLRLDPKKKGKNLRVAALELTKGKDSEDYYDEIVNANRFSKKDVAHSDLVGNVLSNYKSEAEIFLLDCTKDESAKWIMENDIDIVTMSISNTRISYKLQEEMAKKCFIITSSGNSGEEGETMIDEDAPHWWQVGALKLNSQYGFNLMSYSSWGRDHVEGATLAGLETKYKTFHGTSAAAPLYAVQVMDYYEEYYTIFNTKPTPKQTIDFIDRNSSNVLVSDSDSYLKIGYGLLLLPRKYYFKVHEIDGELNRGARRIPKIYLTTEKQVKENATINLEELQEIVGVGLVYNNKTKKIEVVVNQGEH